MGIVEGAGRAVVTPTARACTTLFKKLGDGATTPTKSHPSDAGFDLYASESVPIYSGERAVVRTGVAVAIPQYAVGLVCPRSGLAAKQGITITNAPGIIDAGYRGELMVVLQNTGEHPFMVNAGDRIAQLVVVPFLGMSAEVSELPEADRGDNGFGSTGS